MHLTETHFDGLTELLNIGHGRAAAALSQMTGERVILEVPSLSLIPLEDIAFHLSGRLASRVACVNQAFTGPLVGNAMLLLDEDSAKVLAQLTFGEATTDVPQDVLTEVGNVFLQSCLGAFGNLLEIQISFAVPAFEIDDLPSVLRSISIGGNKLTHAVIAQTRFRLRLTPVTGFLVIILGITSLQCVLGGLDQWERPDHEASL
jgi:chemotaxis protein CheC